MKNEDSTRDQIRERLQSLSPGRFKQFIKELLTRQGYTIDKETHEKYDLLISKRDPSSERNIIKIERDRKDGVEAGEVKAFVTKVGTIPANENIDELWIISSGTFTNRAYDFALERRDREIKLFSTSKSEKPGITDIIEMIDETDSYDWLEKYDLLDPIQTYKITVRVVTKTDKPIENATVTIEAIQENFEKLTKTKRTDSRGKIATELPAGRYVIRVTHEEYAENIETVHLTDNEKVTLPLEKHEATHTLIVRVENANAKPLRGAVVTIQDDKGAFCLFSDGNRKNTTDEAGRVKTELEGGQYTVTAAHKGYLKNSREDLRISEDREITLALEKEANTLTVAVETDKGQPIAKSIVTIRDTDGFLIEAFNGSEKGTTGRKGTVQAKLPDGKYTITAKHEDFNDEATQEIRITEPSKKTLLTLENPKTYSLDITVIDEDDDPVTEALVTIKSQEEDTYPIFETGKIEATTNHRGKVTTKVPNGMYTITVNHENFDRTLKDTVEVNKSNTSLITVFDRSTVYDFPDTIWKKAIYTDLALSLLFALPFLALLWDIQDLPVEPVLALIGGIWLSLPLLLSLNLQRSRNILYWVFYPMSVLLVYILEIVFTTSGVMWIVWWTIIILWIASPILIYMDSRELRKTVNWPAHWIHYILFSSVIGLHIIAAAIYLRQRRKSDSQK